MNRKPAVAHQFYPGDLNTLQRTLSILIPTLTPDEKKIAIAIISPHAGYVYSGAVAGETFARVVIPKDIIILGPNHRGSGAQVALMAEGTWQMPQGNVPINKNLAEKIISHSPLITPDANAHQLEHSLEVQVPFLQYLRKDITLTPLTLSHIDYDTCEKVGRAIAAAIKEYGKKVLIVASTDMTHYESRQVACRKDQLAIDRINSLDPAGLYDTVVKNRISMCGFIPTTISLIAAKEQGATRAELVRYTDSGEASGDTTHVVGYAGFVIA